MIEELNSFLLNEVVNAVLFLILAVLYINSLLDRRIHATKRDRDFSIFLLCSALYIGLMLVWLPLKNISIHEQVDLWVSALRVLAAVLAYGFFGSWILSTAEARGFSRPKLRRSVTIIMLGLFVISLILRITTNSPLAANIPIFLYYLILIVLAIVFRKAIGRTYATMIVVFVVVESLLQFQTWWDYTPANVFLVIGTIIIYSRGWLAEKEQRLENERIVTEQYAKLENMRTKLVLSQIKPHFLFNTLSTIAYLCTKQPKQARDLCVDLTTYLRGNISALDTGMLVSLKKEMQHVEVFLKIEKVRFGDKLNVSYDIQDDSFKLPALTIEPLVENAVKHGIRRRSSSGTVTISTRLIDQWHTVTVHDNGVGFNVSEIDKNNEDHVGIRSVQSRIEKLCGGTLSIESEPGKGTTAILRIPK